MYLACCAICQIKCALVHCQGDLSVPEVASLRQELRGLRESQQAQAARLNVFMDTTSTLITALQAQLTRLLTGHAPAHGLSSGSSATDIMQGSGTLDNMVNGPAFSSSQAAAADPRMTQPGLSFPVTSHPASRLMPGQTDRPAELSSRPGPALASLRQPAMMQSNSAHAGLGLRPQMDHGSLSRGGSKAAGATDSRHGSFPALPYERPTTSSEAGGWHRASLPGSSEDVKLTAAPRQQSCSQSWAQQAWPTTCLSGQADPEARLHTLASQAVPPDHPSHLQVRVNPQLLMHANGSSSSRLFQPEYASASINILRSSNEPGALDKPMQQESQAASGMYAEGPRQQPGPHMQSTQLEGKSLAYPAVQPSSQRPDIAAARFSADSQDASQTGNQLQAQQRIQPQYESHHWAAADPPPRHSIATNMAKQGLHAGQVSAPSDGPAHSPGSADWLVSRRSQVLSHQRSPSSQHRTPQPGFEQFAWGNESPLAVAETASSPPALSRSPLLVRSHALT